MVGSNGRASNRAASKAIRLRPQLSALSCQLSIINSSHLERCEYQFFVSTYPALFPASRLARLSTIRRHLRGPLAQATRRLLLASLRIPPSFPPPAPIPPSALPGPAHQAVNQVYFQPYNVHIRGGAAQRW